MNPLFTQNFKIFAPDVPTVATLLYYKKYIAGHGWSSYQNPGNIFLGNFLRNRFSADRYRFLIYKELVQELQYANEAAKYYAVKNNILPEKFPEFRAKFLASSSGSKFLNSFLMQNSDVSIFDRGNYKFSACLVFDSIPKNLVNSEKSIVSKSTYSFFQIGSNY